MALPTSGPISLSQINTELSYNPATVIGIGNAEPRDLLRVPSGAIGLANGYGKQYAIGATGGNKYLRYLAGRPYYVHYFITSGTFTVTNLGQIGQKLEILVVGAGGGGGSGASGPAGGGGGGGVLRASVDPTFGNTTVTVPPATYEVDGVQAFFGPYGVNGGGRGGNAKANGQNGSSGGGAGGTANQPDGNAANTDNINRQGGVPFVPGGGYNGGARGATPSPQNYAIAGAGGGGMAGFGETKLPDVARRAGGSGGLGVSHVIPGEVFYGLGSGGGGAGTLGETGGIGGYGGDGGGYYYQGIDFPNVYVAAGAGLTYGCGGGGGYAGVGGGIGASGVVIVWYPLTRV